MRVSILKKIKKWPCIEKSKQNNCHVWTILCIWHMVVNLQYVVCMSVSLFLINLNIWLIQWMDIRIKIVPNLLNTKRNIDWLFHSTFLLAFCTNLCCWCMHLCKKAKRYVSFRLQECSSRKNSMFPQTFNFLVENMSYFHFYFFLLQWWILCYLSD
jgi:hypothetical protein